MLEVFFHFRVNTYDYYKVFELGFGSTEFGMDYSYTLKVAGANALPNSNCAQAYSSDPTVSITTQDLCTYSTDRNDTCQVFY